MKLLLESWRRFVVLHEGISPETIEKIEKAIARAGGESYIVGGAVRDELIPGAPSSKDIDFLIRKLSLDRIKASIQHLGKVKEVGQAFGIVTATIDGEEFDFAIPRTSETKTGEKHTDFEVTTDPNAPIEADLGRRDFTINALARDPRGQVIDMFGGQKDIEQKIIRAVGDANKRFAEDPLRMLRAIQFATRFDFTIEPKTAEAIKKNLDKLDTLAGERILLEFEKAWTKGATNSARFIELLEGTGIGKHIFGETFQPKPVVIPGDSRNKVLGNAMAFFMHGGDYAKMKPSADMAKHIELARTSLSGREVYDYGGKDRDKLELLAEILQQVGYPEESEKIRTTLDTNLPLHPKELAVGGADLVQLGFKGPRIGQIQKRLLQAVHAGEVKNENDQLINYLDMLEKL
tara:strand:- start:1356 stop:2570 length:1215 start_codon:yes stop_codon:yes gene_type:complete